MRSNNPATPFSFIPHSRPETGSDAVEAALAALRERRLAQGVDVERLERMLMEKIGNGVEAVAVSSGTAALYLALSALDFAPGNRVIIPSYACASVYAAVAHVGAEPLCADVGADTVVLTPETVAPLIGPGVAAIIAPHIFGFEVDIAGLQQWGVPVIEDCAQTFGPTSDGGVFGAQGDLAVFSFYATKLMPAGEGGAVVSANRKWAEQARAWRQCDEQPLHPRAFNFKMSDIAAALAGAQLACLPAALARRNEIAQRYDSALGAASFRLRSSRPQPVCFRYLVETSVPLESVLAACHDAGVICRRPVWAPLHGSLGGVCPNTEERHARLLSAPIYPSLSEEELDRVLKALAPFL